MSELQLKSQRFRREREADWRRLGAHIVEAPAERIGPEILNVYLDLKRRDLL